MFITSKRSGYDRTGQQVASGLFLILMQPKSWNDKGETILPMSSSSYPIRALVRHVSMSQFGNFMMGRARVHGHTLILSGSYGSDGLPDTVPMEVYNYGVPLPPELYEAWKNGEGWNSAGSEAPKMREWALAHLKELRA
jgi:hypothetical protein